jgi:hypothetical protein
MGSPSGDDIAPHGIYLDGIVGESGEVVVFSFYWCPLKIFGVFSNLQFLGQPMCRTYK